MPCAPIRSLFCPWRKQQLGGQTDEAKLTLEAKELAIKNLLTRWEPR